MAITINGSGTVTGITAGGLPDGVITTDDLAANAVTTAKLGADEASGLCKAWVNFDGTGTVAIREAFNVSSITDNATGAYTVNFTTAMPDANYCVSVTPFLSRSDNATLGCGSLRGSTRTTTSAKFATTNYNDTAFVDAVDVNVAIFR